MKVHEQFKNINSQFDNSNHRFINAIYKSIIDKIGVSNDLDISVDKSIDGDNIHIKLVANKMVGDADDLHKIKNDVRRTIDNLKNESNLLFGLDI